MTSRLPESPGRKPHWLKVSLGGGNHYATVKRCLHHRDLHTVCEEARCPNAGECWNSGTATVLILGDICTRGCRFCATKTGRPAPLDAGEPERVAKAIAELGLKYVVLTSVDRDDLPDGGSEPYAETIRQIRRFCPEADVEVLIPDFGGSLEALKTVLAEAPGVVAHNVEVVRRLTPSVRDRRASYEGSLAVLENTKKLAKTNGYSVPLTKSSIMLGLGETEAEVRECMEDLRRVDCDMLTLGQYLRPTRHQIAEAAYISPESFERYEALGKELGFGFVASGPLVRSSYRAAELFAKGKLAKRTEKR